MSNSVYGIALSGLNAARAGLSTTSHNIANSNTVGFNRQQVIQQSRPSTGSDIGFIGQGVDIASVQRVYSDFINSQEQKATSDAAFYNAKAQQIARVDAMIADDASGLSSALSIFFGAAQTLSTNPADLAARQNYLSSAETLSSRFNGLNTVMDELRSATNLKVRDTVEQLNNATSQIAALNNQIVTAQNQTSNGGPPNDLMDRRDKLILELSEQVQTTRVDMADGSTNLFLANGQSLVIGTTQFKVQTQVDPQDPQNLLVGMTTNVNGQDRLLAFDSSSLGNGALAGFLSFREDELTEYQNTIGLLAARIGQTVNDIQTAGVDLDNNPASALFSFGSSGSFVDDISRVVPNVNNSTVNPTQVTLRGLDLSKLGPAEYEVQIVGSQPRYREVGSDGPFVPANLVTDPGGDYYEIRDPAGAPLLSFQLNNATPQEGDRFVLMPVREAALNMRTALDRPSEVAASSAVNPSIGNNENILAVAALQNSRTLFQSNNSAGVSISDGFNQLVSRVGNKTREFNLAAESRETVLNQVADSRDALQGVNMDEEAANLIKFQQAYQASGRVISLSKELFDQILSMF
ncbi:MULTISPECIES: flagellar hook-associated protein FlgK [Limnobacter]|jgi:flagellar hook-associated protein 1|uniref:Flagellar hook-associated protein 1 n=1 Tax=Limnobacter profundi TaxID=2732163 RepID=A0ABX6N589_9BURK|nr:MULTISPECIES: flagellar hook-associated protein FlgK [unclassified Limnobacter]MAG82150.1 flagellar hook-associated protein FlgK [Sutterellaceae bacterium]MBA4313754.1 flagellar hook-associated protein FlgK [Alcaligenaceae bacterium]QJR29105.1 flagellar hook-associated protein FlgK [Limnobacter sp. SAORIC-580]|tara:strand:+ start:16109 stop:17842 length:1734 start_codon:yes stop_codon:yes gene_type:complete